MIAVDVFDQIVHVALVASLAALPMADGDLFRILFLLLARIDGRVWHVAIGVGGDLRYSINVWVDAGLLVKCWRGYRASGRLEPFGWWCVLHDVFGGVAIWKLVVGGIHGREGRARVVVDRAAQSRHFYRLCGKARASWDIDGSDDR